MTPERQNEEQIITSCYQLIRQLLEDSWPAESKRRLLEDFAPSVREIAAVATELRQRSFDMSLPEEERVAASRHGTIVHCAASILSDFGAAAPTPRLRALLTSWI